MISNRHGGRFSAKWPLAELKIREVLRVLFGRTEPTVIEAMQADVALQA